MRVCVAVIYKIKRPSKSKPHKPCVAHIYHVWLCRDEEREVRRDEVREPCHVTVARMYHTYMHVPYVQKALQQRVDTGQAKGNLRGVLCKKGQAHQMDAEKKKMTGIEKRNIRRGRPREAKIFDKSNR